MTSVIIPVKHLASAKTRLSPALTAQNRAGLVLAMLEDVLRAAGGTGGHAVRVVSGDTRVLDVARRFGAGTVHEDRPGGYNAAVRLGLAEVASAGAVAILPGDVPAASARELERLFAPSPTDPCVRLVPAHDRRGTNGLFMTSADLLRPAFGPGSFAAHRAAAAKAGLHTQVLDLSGLARDIDEPADLAAFQAGRLPGATSRFLAGITRRPGPANPHDEGSDDEVAA